MSLEKIRIQRGLTQAKLAELTGIHKSTISKIERGQIQIDNVTGKNLRKLADALKVTIEDLLVAE